MDILQIDNSTIMHPDTITNYTDSYGNSMGECYVTHHDEPYLQFSTFVNAYMTTACVILGTIGNLHGVKSVHVCNIDKNRGVVLAVSMLALAFWDTVLLWCAFVYFGMKRFPFAVYCADLINLLIPWFHAFSQIANTASIWCVVAITLQRFAATRDPFRASRTVVIMQSFRSERRVSFIYCSHYRRLLRMPILLSICAILLNFTTFFEIKSEQCFDRNLNRTAIQLATTFLRTNPNYKLYRLISRMLFVSIGPNVFILCISIMTMFYLRGSNRMRRQLFQMNDNILERHTSRENMQTMIAIVLVMKFLLFRSLTFCLDIVEVTIGIYSYYLVDISNFLVMVNSATNCLIYLKASKCLSSKYVERRTVRRKKTICDSGQLLGDRLSILCSSWDKALEMTNGELGARVAHSMVRKKPTLSRSDEPEKEALLNGSCKRSIDPEKMNEIGARISGFIAELLQMMKSSETEEYIIMRIRRVGAVHYDKGIVFNSSVWKEFKHTIQLIMAECPYASSQERDAALDAWNIFISFIIREMKMGMWAIDNISQMQ